MKLSTRLTTTLSALLLAGLTATATGCAPSTSDNRGDGTDRKTGTLRVWLFQEVNNKPKAAIVDKAVKAFTARHEGVKVDVRYIPVESRAERMKAAFNDPASAPDLVEYGNTDTAGYVRDGGLADVTEEFDAWDEAKDTDGTARASVTVDGKVYGAPLFVGVRALYYRTDVFDDLGLKPPRTLKEVADTARRIRAERPDLYGLAVGGAYTYGAMPFVWAHGGDIATERDGKFRAAVDSPASRAGITAYTDLFGKDNCPASRCARMGGNDTVEAFAAGKAGMAIAGDFSRQAVEAGGVKGKYAVVPLPGVRSGEIAPAFAGGNNLGVLRSTSHRTLAVELMRELAGKQTQRELFEAMGFLPTFDDVREEVAADEPFVEPFVRTLQAGARFVPATPAWGQIDAGQVLPTMFQEIASGRKDVDTASADAAHRMNDTFTKTAS
ncbi:extracellular solute-binding protein [Streptomyces durbertensis]|uniref:Extracellular solute-binding protein n=1 Tax=Streptomyces durbertensis TaxID=2448886 RepID=A0ABR6ECG4_9ACTN|nr:extracellular solute-binding protein [Streptomyces durbertensis]MBB1242189.1 extracellular solute-binding protein [Streptomyces durbertensis]